MKKKKFYFLTVLILSFCSIAIAKEQINTKEVEKATSTKKEEKHEPKFGIVNFSTCITESKYGKEEQASFEQVKTQMTTLISDLEKQLQEIANKFNDAEFLDSLSPEAEQEMKVKFQGLSEEYNRYQNQYMQVLNQANMKLIQAMNHYVNQASNSVAKKNQLSMILREDTCFYYTDKDDITNQIIKEMDNDHDKQQSVNQTTAQTEETKK